VPSAKRVVNAGYRPPVFPRMVTGGIMFLDEYKDPTWPGCTQAVDEFLTGKAERIIEIKSDNHLKYYLRKL
jgi:hypothetical protein